MVEQIEGLATELEMDAFSDIDVFKQAGIDSPPSWALHDIPLGIASADLVAGHRGKGVDIEPMQTIVDGTACRCGAIWIIDAVRPAAGHARTEDDTYAGWVEARRCHVEREAGIEVAKS